MAYSVAAFFIHSDFFALGLRPVRCLDSRADVNISWGTQMKKLVVALLATVVAFSVAGCAGMGKGKAPPVVTKG